MSQPKDSQFPPVKNERAEVVVVDIQMRFYSMMVFMIKAVLASNPAAIVLYGFAMAIMLVFIPWLR